MFVEDCFGIKNGVLTIDGADTTELAKNYGTPLYVMSESCIRKNCK
jgi:diaminopimelate decarboxylase